MKYAEWLRANGHHVSVGYGPVNEDLEQMLPGETEILAHVVDRRDDPEEGIGWRHRFLLLTAGCLYVGHASFRKENGEAPVSLEFELNAYPLAHVSQVTMSTFTVHNHASAMFQKTTKRALQFSAASGLGKLDFPVNEKGISSSTLEAYRKFAEAIQEHLRGR